VNKNSSDVLIDAAGYSISELAYAEFEVMGLFLERHPFAEIEKSLEKCGVKNSSYIKGDIKNGSHKLRLAGVITKKDARMSPRGRFITLILADPEGIFEVTIFNEDILRDYAHLINVKEAVVVYCDVFKDNGGIRVTASKFMSVEDELDGVQHSLKLYPQDTDEVTKIINVLENKKHPTKSNSSIEIFLPLEEEFVAKVSMPKQFVLDEKDVAVLEKK
jgi:DNA polymerase-3 subunit alpha